MYRYTLESNTKGLRDLSEIQRWTVIPAKLLTLFIIPTLDGDFADKTFRVPNPFYFIP